MFIHHVCPVVSFVLTGDPLPAAAHPPNQFEASFCLKSEFSAMVVNPARAAPAGTGGIDPGGEVSIEAPCAIHGTRAVAAKSSFKTMSRNRLPCRCLRTGGFGGW